MRLPALLAAAALILPAGAVIAQHAGHHQAADPIATAIAASSRTPTNIVRDKYRHPAETLAFFGVTPKQTVVEYAPSGGWYTEILAPLLRDHGTFYALQPTGRYLDGYKQFLAAKPDVYGKVKVVAYPEENSAISANSVDTVLTFRNVHNMVMWSIIACRRIAISRWKRAAAI
jgi:predicted methyltransferase